MILKKSFLLFLILGFLLLISTSCQKDHSPEFIVPTSGTLAMDVIHFVNGKDLVTDTLIYTTSVGNRYMVNDLQYFISRVSLHQLDGTWIETSGSPGILYIDVKAVSPFSIIARFPSGVYDSVGFVFGLDEQDNQSGRFPDPPERDMFWPDILGGGYHYMKMNMKWKNDSMTETMPFMFHLGIGQMYDGTTANPDSIIGFIQNYFRIHLPVAVMISPNFSASVGIAMNIEKWFDGQNAFDFSEYSMGIMQDQLGMHRACMNGRGAFSVHDIGQK